MKYARSVLAIVLTIIAAHATDKPLFGQGSLVIGDLQLAAPAAAQVGPPSDAGIYIGSPDGSDFRALAKLPDCRWQGSPAWSGESKQIAFEAQPKSTRAQDMHIYKVEEKGGEAKDLGLGRYPSWSPDGKQIVFAVPTSNTSNTKAGIWVMNADGAGREWLSPGRTPRFSPDGAYISSVNSRQGIDTIFLWDVVEGTRKSILNEKYQHIYGTAWSPDGKQICFVGNRPDNTAVELAMIDIAAGADAQPKVRQTGDIGHEPSWGPGNKILLWITADGQHRLHLIDPATEDAPIPLKCGESNQQNINACWSPDGKSIAVSFNPQ
jgi:dipeptidyl aminopeptidase/acylaminoacyl peptidase